MPGRTPRPGSQRVGLQFALVVFVIVGVFLDSVPAAAQAPPKVFRLGYLSPAGRTPDGGPPRPFREACEPWATSRAGTSRTRLVLPRASWRRYLAWRRILSDSTSTLSWRREERPSRRRGGQPRPFRSSSRSHRGMLWWSGGSRASHAQAQTSLD